MMPPAQAKPCRAPTNLLVSQGERGGGDWRLTCYKAREVRQVMLPSLTFCPPWVEGFMGEGRGPGNVLPGGHPGFRQP